MQSKTLKKKREIGLEKKYLELFPETKEVIRRQENESLEQPFPVKPIRTVTTYGAYQDPI